MKEIAVTKAVINRMLQQDPRVNVDFGSDKKGIKSKASKNSIRQVSSNHQLITTKNNSLDQLHFPGDVEPMTTNNQNQTEE